MILPAPWKKGDRLLATHLDEDRQAIAEIASMMGLSSPGIGGARPRLGLITDEGPDGEGDYTDHRYWVQLIDIGAEQDPDEVATPEGEDPKVFSESETPDGSDEKVIITATNFSEVESGAHAASGYVILHPFWGYAENSKEPSVVWLFNYQTRVPLVKVTGSASGGGKYTGVIWNPPTSNIPSTGNLSEAELGESGDVVRIVNTREVGKSTHDLSTSGFLPLIFPAFFLKVADDDVPVYAIDGLQWEDCA